MKSILIALSVLIGIGVIGAVVAPTFTYACEIGDPGCGGRPFQ
jgi:hypothetical protein